MIQIHGSPIVNAGPDRFILPGDTILLGATVTGDTSSFLWSPPEGLMRTDVLTPRCFSDKEITYTLEATSVYGCTGSDDVTVSVISGVYIPTAFTPNHDGLNDVWRIPGIDPTMGIWVSVYNVYGQEVYHTEGTTVFWDGTRNGVKQPSGNYVYLVRLGNKILKGTITLIR